MMHSRFLRVKRNPPPLKTLQREPERPLTKLGRIKHALAQAVEANPGIETKNLITLFRRLPRSVFETHPAADAEHRQAAAINQELAAILDEYHKQQEAIAKATNERLKKWEERARVSGIL